MRRFGLCASGREDKAVFLLVWPPQRIFSILFLSSLLRGKSRLRSTSYATYLWQRRESGAVVVCLCVLVVLFPSVLTAV